MSNQAVGIQLLGSLTMRIIRKFVNVAIKKPKINFQFIKFYIGLLIFAISSFSQAAQLNLAWDPNTEANLGGYELRYGTSSGNYPSVVDVGNQTSFTLTGLTEGTRYYIVVVAYDTTKTIRSPASNEVNQLIPITTATATPTPTATATATPTPVPTTTATMGFASIGSNIDSSDSNYLNATRFVMGATDGTAVSMSVYVASPIGASPNNMYQVAIFSDVSGAPGALIASSATKALVGDAWNTIAISAPLKANTAYWLGYNTNGLSDSVNNVRYSSGAINQTRWMARTFGSMPATFASIGSGNYQMSIYVSYTAGTTTTTTPTPTPTATPTADTTAPLLSGGLPTGTLAAGTTSTTLRLTTNENSTCRYSTTAGIAYSSMTSQFATTGGTSHSQSITGLTNGITRTYYVRCRDAAGNMNSADYTIRFSVAQAVSQTLLTSQLPTLLAVSDGGSSNYELGMRFTATSAGTITGIRFYKSASESGTHVGKIYSASGAVLAQVTFSGETASGWQTATLSAPLAILANTEYTVSVNTGNTYYVDTVGGMASQISNGNLRSVVGSNGVYGPVGAKPTNSWNNSNYFRDIVFVPTP